MSTFDSIELQRIDGSTTTLAEFKGKALLIVNVASKCGLTSQYEGLEALYSRYKDQGLEVLGFPANDFLGQEPGSNEEIQEFCRGTFGVDFPMFAKVTVTGADKTPLYRALTEAKPTKEWEPGSGFRQKMVDRGLIGDSEEEVSWNFEKFLLNRDHELVARFAPDFDPQAPQIVSAIEDALK